MSDNNENVNEESDSLSPLNNNRVNNMNLINNSTTMAAAAAGNEAEDGNGAVVARLREQIQGLKNLSSLKQNLLNIRENQVKEMIQKLKFFEEAVANEKVKRGELNDRVDAAEADAADLAERLRANVAEFDNAKSDYENRIVELIANLEGSNAKGDAARARVAELETKVAETCVDHSLKKENRTEIEKDKSDSGDSPSTSSSNNENLVAEIQNLKAELKEATEKNRILSYQMTLLNRLFMETEETAIDFDRIRAIGDIVRGSMDLAKENGDMDGQDTVPPPDSEYLDAACASSARKASFDVPGLIEKLNASNEKKMEEIPGEESCYKSVDTTAGPKLVLSVSLTFIKLKDLILEKKALQKEIDGLKELNDKLSVKVDQEERRLYCVTGELNKTWSLVATLKAQHKQLHNSKAVLRYELQEKRKLLEKLKRDLSLSREKWIRVRQKNSESETEWLKIREEFKKRRNQVGETSQISQEESTSGVCLSEEGQPLLQHSTSASTMSDDDQQGDQQSVTTQKSPNEARKYYATEGPSKSKSTESADVEDNDNENIEPEDLEALEEGACGIDYAKVAFDDPLDELEDLAAEIKTIEAAAATSDDDEEDDDVGDGNGETSGVFNGTELNLERLVNRRAARLQALEEQCRQLYKKLSASKVKSITLSAKLAKLHNHYGSDSDDTTTDQSRPTETSDDTAYASGRAESRNHERDGRGDGYEQLGNDGDLDPTEMPSEMESQDEQELNNVPLTANADAAVQPINSNESEVLSPVNSNNESEVEVHIASASGEQIASENRELLVAEAVGQSTNDHNLDSMNRENATIIITDETIEQIARSQNHLIVRNGDVILAPRPHSVPTSQYDEPSRSPDGNTQQISHSHQNLASALTITNPVVVSTASHESLNSSPIPMNPASESSPIPPDNDSPLMTAELDPSCPSDLNMLGRLIIQQLPKRLDILKHENNALRDELHLGDKILKKTEEELRNEKQLSHLLRTQIEQQNLLEIKLQEELELQQQIIDELKNEIGNGKECFDNVLSEKQVLSNFVALYNQDKDIHDERFVARSHSRKNCSSCGCKFGFFKKRHNCKICGFDFCSKCSHERKFQEVGGVAEPSTSSSAEKVKGHICTTCAERRDKLETLRVAATLEANV